MYYLGLEQRLVELPICLHIHGHLKLYVDHTHIKTIKKVFPGIT